MKEEGEDEDIYIIYVYMYRKIEEHRNIVKLIKYFEDEKYFYIVFELCENLSDFIKKKFKGNKLPIDFI